MIPEEVRRTMRCVGCNKTPEQLPEYQDMAAEYGVTPAEFVWREEGTLNPENGHFACTNCYIEMGSPTAPGRGWKAP